MDARQNNWGQLQKFFKKRDLEVSAEDWNGVLHCDGDSAMQFMRKLYTLLTKRPLKELPSKGTSSIPH
eukprot:CAMPEP_0116912766 /NCGR_PEP_ID=MMETSP0467-20121206/16290_1 /TAXON_ID=283647 /ORGANISM="Mesodinium pulex, Strain SPMC105" /LENGTH=67 /DNA_ID=CAMNT_0004588825 /DNA_START=174 /DNA_END=377 /DNA_ORIENTATION=-